jgi:hypothetical protein
MATSFGPFTRKKFVFYSPLNVVVKDLKHCWFYRIFLLQFLEYLNLWGSSSTLRPQVFEEISVFGSPSNCKSLSGSLLCVGLYVNLVSIGPFLVQFNPRLNNLLSFLDLPSSSNVVLLQATSYVINGRNINKIGTVNADCSLLQASESFSLQREPWSIRKSLTLSTLWTVNCRYAINFLN